MANLRKKELVVGIIGGMGPQATIDFIQKIVDATPAEDDKDHIRLLIDNNPKIPSRVAALVEGGGDDPSEKLITTAQGLQCQGTDFIAMPCNTAHFYYNQIARSVSIPVLNMVQMTINHIIQADSTKKKVGILGSTALQITDLYRLYAEEDFEFYYPSEQQQQKLMDLIFAIKSKQSLSELLQNYQQTIDNLVSQGVDSLLIACTELSCISQRVECGITVYDSLDILASSVVNLCKK